MKSFVDLVEEDLTSIFYGFGSGGGRRNLAKVLPEPVLSIEPYSLFIICQTISCLTIGFIHQRLARTFLGIVPRLGSSFY